VPVLIRGASGAGKSRLAFDLILAGRSGQLPKAVLVGDDRVHLDTAYGEIVVRPARELAGLIEIRGLGIRRCEFAGAAIVGLVVESRRCGCRAPAAAGNAHNAHFWCRNTAYSVAAGYAALPLVVAALTTTGSSTLSQPSADCLKGIGNHMKAHNRDRIDRYRALPQTVKFRENSVDPLLRGGSGWSKWRVFVRAPKSTREEFR